jgi:hypothetical protein
MSHAAPTFCIHVPMFEATEAIHSARNKGSRRGLQVDLVSAGSRGMIVPEVHGSGMRRLEAAAAADDLL